MSHRHRKVLHALFAHPISANIDFKEVASTLRELGAEIENRHGARIAVALNGRKALFHRANHALPKEDVVQIKKLLIDCGAAPEQYPV